MADSPEQSLAMFAETLFGRSGFYQVTSIRRSELVYVEEKDNTNDDN